MPPNPQRSPNWLTPAFRPGPVHWALLAAGFLVRIGYALRVSRLDAFGGWDGLEYWGFAKSLAAFAGDDYPRFFGYIRSPGYPLLLAPFAWLDIDPVRPVQWLQSLAGTGLAWILAEVTTRWAGRIAGSIALVLALFHPFLIHQSAYVLTECAFVCLLWLGLAALQRLDDPEPTVPDWARPVVWAGLLMGLATLVRPALQLFLPVAAIAIAMKAWRRQTVVAALRQSGVFTIVVSALLLPWQVGNRLAHGEFNLGPGYGQAAYLLCNSMEYYRMCEARTKWDYYRDFQTTIEQLGATNGIPRDQWMSVARRFREEHPAEWQRLQWYKMRHFLRPWVNPVSFGRAEVLVSALVGIPLFAGALFEVLRRRGRLEGFGWLVVLLAFTGFLAGGVLFSASVRYRIPMVDVTFIVLTASWLGNVQARRLGPSSPIAPPRPHHDPASLTANVEPPLCVDLDGTLIPGDTLKMSVLKLLVRRPWQVVPLFAALLDGLAAFKAAVAARWLPAVESLPYRPSVLAFLREERQRGRRLVLATAAHHAIGEAVANHLGLFDAVIASDERHNRKSGAKVDAIREWTGGRAFDYVGDSRADLPVFAAARKGYLVAATPAVLRAARAAGHIERVFES